MQFYFKTAIMQNKSEDMLVKYLLLYCAASRALCKIIGTLVIALWNYYSKNVFFQSGISGIKCNLKIDIEINTFCFKTELVKSSTIYGQKSFHVKSKLKYI